MGLGNLPDATPAHQVERDTGMIGGIPWVLSPTIWRKRRNPVWGIEQSILFYLDKYWLEPL